MSKKFEPLKGFNKPYSLEELQYPVIGSPKLDGIRAVATAEGPKTRTMLDVPNWFIKSKFADADHWCPGMLLGLDGELIGGSPVPLFEDDSVMSRSTTAVMTRDGEPDFTYWVFDIWNEPTPFSSRISSMHARFLPIWAKRVPQVWLHSAEEVRAYYQLLLDEGYEGAVLRYPGSMYKQGRSTLKEGALLKLKPYVDFEATIIGFVEAVKNDNVAKESETGHTKRSHAKAGRTEGKGYVGRITCVTDAGIEFGIGTLKGLSTADKKHMWENRELFIGKTAKVKSLGYGVKTAPRSPTFLGIRED